MFKIEDIKERLIINPEPPEVEAIRKKILESFKDLEFIEEGHKYFLNLPSGNRKELISVSGFCEKFENKKDWDAIKVGYAKKNNLTVDQVTRMWRENNIRSTNNGTSTHLFGEMYMHFYMGHPELICDVIKPQYEDGFLIPYSQKQEAIVKLYQDLSKVQNIYPVIPETKVYTDSYAGTFDALFATKINGEWGLLVYDLKTNKELTKDFARQKGEYMLPPFNNMIDEPLGHYTIQLSAYSLALMYLGFKIFDRKLLWLKDDGTYEKLTLPDVTDRIISLGVKSPFI